MLLKTSLPNSNYKLFISKVSPFLAPFWKRRLCNIKTSIQFITNWFNLQISHQSGFKKQDATSNSNQVVNFNGETNNNNKVIYPWHSLVPFLVTKKSPATAGSSSNDTKRSSGGPSGGPGSGPGSDPHYPGPDGSANNLFKDDENAQSQNPDHDNNETGSETGSLNNTHQNNNGKIRQKDKIRRPMNAFMIFSKRHRPLVRLLNMKLFHFYGFISLLSHKSWNISRSAV